MILNINERAPKSAQIWHPLDWYVQKTGGNANKILRGLSKQLGRELKIQLKVLPKFNDPAAITMALHLTIDNLANVQAASERTLAAQSSQEADSALAFLDEQIAGVKIVLQSEIVSACVQASSISNRTLGLLFCAKQTIKQRYSIITPSSGDELSISNGRPAAIRHPEIMQLSETAKNSAVRRLVIPSSLLYQLHQSLFPAERMMVAAGKRNGSTISVEGIFEVTGMASALHVQADPEKLGRALIAMSETDTYFAWWIHSHPSQGSRATCPSDIDRNQEIDWLNDYSAELVNAIMVKDGYIRFWGKAIKEKRINVDITGVGVSKEPGNDQIYRLEN